MRTIKFRGKTGTTKGKKWIYGYLYTVKSFFKDKEYQYFIRDEHLQDAAVDEETIGQYTGLHDKNGKEIYEGDIIEFSYDIFTGNFDTKVGKGIIEFIGGAFHIKPFEIENKKEKDIENEEWFLLYSVNEDTLEIIGNIYENADLLKD